MLKKLAERGEVRLFETSDIIFAIGDRGEEMYLIEEGRVDLFFEPGKEPKSLGPGELFGELAYIVGNHVRTASAVASEGTRLRAFDQQGLDDLLECMPIELFLMARNACEYLVRSEQALLRQLQCQERELQFSLNFAGRVEGEVESMMVGGNLVDGASGLFSRDYLDKYLRKIADNPVSRGRSIGVLAMRMDALSLVSKQLGENFGEKMLGWVCEELHAVIREGDLAGRLGEESFALLLLDADRMTLENVRGHLRERMIQSPVELPGKAAIMVPAIGLAHSDDGVAIRDLLISAESELTAIPSLL
jgi:diguanylate cyclase (GGDEF)-like protein